MEGVITFHENERMEMPFIFTKEEITPLTVHARLFDGLVLAWVTT